MRNFGDVETASEGTAQPRHAAALHARPSRQSQDCYDSLDDIETASEAAAGGPTEDEHHAIFDCAGHAYVID